MSFSGEHDEANYIIVVINIHVVNDIYSGNYVCGVLDYNTGTCWNCDDNTITNYSRNPVYVYGNVSNEK